MSVALKNSFQRKYFLLAFFKYINCLKSIFGLSLTVIITLLLSLAALVACNEGGGGGGSGDGSTTEKVAEPPAASSNSVVFQGKVVTDYSEAGKVCLDLDNTGSCGSSNPDTSTDSVGEFRLSVSPQTIADIQTITLIAELVGAEGVNKVPLAKTIALDSDQHSYTEQIITPATTLIWSVNSNPSEATASNLVTHAVTSYGEESTTLSTARRVAEFLEVDQSDLLADPLVVFEQYNNPQLFHQSIKVIKAIQYLKTLASDMDWKELYASLLKGKNEKGNTASFDEIVTIPLTSQGEEQNVNDALDNIDNHIKKIVSANFKDEDTNILRAQGDVLAMNTDGVTEAIDKEDIANIGITAETIKGRNDSLLLVTSDLFLPTRGKYRTKIFWTSSNPALVATNGKITRAESGSSPVEVILTYTLFKGVGSKQGSFHVLVQPEQATLDDKARVEKDYQWLTFDLINTTRNISRQKVATHLTLPAHGQEDESTITWKSNHAALEVLGSTGNIIRPPEFNRIVNLTATITSGTESKQKSFRMLILSQQTTTEDLIIEALANLTERDILGANVSLDKVTTDLTLPVAWYYGSSIEWFSSNEAIQNTGEVTRTSFDIYTDLSASVTMTESVARTKTFQITILADDGEVALAKAYRQLTFNAIRLNNLSDIAIIDDLDLYTEAEEGVTIVWNSSDTDLMSNNGFISRPVNDTEITLTATLTKHAASKTQTFTLVLLGTSITTTSVLQQDYDRLTFAFIAGGNQNEDAITSKLQLIRQGLYGSEISWRSSNTDVITPYGFIIRPSSDAPVELTATITDGTDQLSKTFSLTALAQAQVDTSNQFNQSVLNTSTGEAKYSFRLYGKPYLIKLRSNLVITTEKIRTTEPVNLYFTINGKRYSQNIEIAANYLDSNVIVEIYPPNSEGEQQPLYTSENQFINLQEEEIAFTLSGESFFEYIPPNPSEQWGLELPPHIPAF